MNEALARVMGTTAHVAIRGDGSPQTAIGALSALERRWSRFMDDSELSRLGRAAGAPMIVSPETALLLRCCEQARRRTGGLFDPTQLDELEAAGYDRTFEQLDVVVPATREDLGESTDHLVAPGEVVGGELPTRAGRPRQIDVPDMIEWSGNRPNIVRLPAGLRIDPGGIGKGLAADLVAGEAVTNGAEAAMVSVGGDLRIAGEAPVAGWEIEVDHHVVTPARVNLRSGALATSSRLARRWRTDAGVRHHVIDPRTGEPALGEAAAVSVLAGEAWWAEAVATAILVGFASDDSPQWIEGLLDGAGALVTTVDGRRHRLGPLGSSFSSEGSNEATAPSPRRTSEPRP